MVRLHIFQDFDFSCCLLNKKVFESYQNRNPEKFKLIWNSIYWIFTKQIKQTSIFFLKLKKKSELFLAVFKLFTFLPSVDILNLCHLFRKKINLFYKLHKLKFLRYQCINEININYKFSTNCWCCLVESLEKLDNLVLLCIYLNFLFIQC